MSNIYEVMSSPEQFEQILLGNCKAYVSDTEDSYVRGDILFIYQQYVATTRVLAAKVTYVDRVDIFTILSLEIKEE